MNEKIELAFIRNQLLNNNFKTEYQEGIVAMKESLIKFNNPFYELCSSVLSYALDDIDNQEFERAGYQVNLIHNVPFDLNNINLWNEKHFFEFEVPTYFENTFSEQRIKKMILILANLIKILK